LFGRVTFIPQSWHAKKYPSESAPRFRARAKIDPQLPISRIIFCGIAGLSMVPPDAAVVEGVAAHSFVRLMLDIPI
jgi:hypothetical protein